MLITLVACAAIAPRLQSSEVELWGKQCMDTIQAHFYLPKSRLFAESFAPGKSQHPAFNWGVGVMLSAFNAAARLDSAYKPRLREFLAASRVYWNDKGPVPGYDVLPGPKPVDRYYDDNEWMVLQLMEAYENLGDRQALQWARETLRYVMSGYDENLGGGIYWREAAKSSKNTCSNGPAVASVLAVYRLTKEARLLSKAIQVYNWTKRNLQDPSDHLFWDSISLSGRVDRTKWSYNTALMIRSANDLFRLTGNPAYKKDLVVMTASAKARWIGSGIKDEGKFAHLLWDVLLSTGGVDTREVFSVIKAVHGFRSAQGFYGSRFDRGADSNQMQHALIDQVSAARAFFASASYLRKNGK